VHNLADALERFAVRVLGCVRKDIKAGEAATATPELLAPGLATAVPPGRL